MGNPETERVKAAETHHFGAEVAKVLHLVIHSLYTHKDIFLRELISNASDACDKLRYEALQKPELLAGDAEPKIRLSADRAARMLTIADNGIGMSREELIGNLGTVARSGTQEFINSREGGNPEKEGKDADPRLRGDVSLIGQFGVGFYSAFMVASRVEVLSTRAGENKTWHWESDGAGEFTVRAADETLPRGTRITLHLREGEAEYLDTFRLRHIVQTYSDHIAFPIELAGEEGEAEVVNSASALWARPKAEITTQQYHEFYRHVAHSPEEPWLTLHVKAEGTLEYTALLFVPGIKPFDLFHPDRKRRVKLYIRRVFITDEGVELIPHYLRFLRGVIDSQDLPLNISRETLQASPLLARIRESVVKRVLSEMKKKAESDEQGYAKFWSNFGPVLKEGLCEAQSPREPLLEACRFYSTHGEALISLDAYIARMLPGQEHIYTLTGERLEALRGSPQIEGFRRRGVEVLLLTDHVDDFWLSVVTDYKGKPFKSVTRADIDLSRIGAPEDASAKEEPKPTAPTGLIQRFKEVLGASVSDVRATDKLDASPACLAVEEGAMDMRLERFLLEQKQLTSASAKILEINPAHPIIRALEGKLADDRAKDEVADVIWLLLDQARVMEGEEVADPAAFSRRLSQFVQRSLAA